MDKNVRMKKLNYEIRYCYHWKYRRGEKASEEEEDKKERLARNRVEIVDGG